MRKPSKEQISAVMKAMSQKGASKGGIARAKTLTAERRREIARMGGIAKGLNFNRKKKVDMVA